VLKSSVNTAPGQRRQNGGPLGEIWSKKLKYLLYIDILGFSNLVGESNSKIVDLYHVIDELNVHSHTSFKTIVFSDTIIVYNLIDPISTQDHQYIVMYSIEFAQDLQYRLFKKNIFFRAQLRYGEFENFSLKNIECFYGKALINSYTNDKNFHACGLFIDDHSNEYNIIFPSQKYCQDMHFIFINQALERYYAITPTGDPIDPNIIVSTSDQYFLVNDILFIKQLYQNSIQFENPSIPTKYISTFDFFRKRYTHIVNKLIETNFDCSTLCNNFDFSKIIDECVNENR